MTESKTSTKLPTLVLEFVANKPSCTAREIANGTGIKVTNIYYTLSSLEKRDKLRSYDTVAGKRYSIMTEEDQKKQKRIENIQPKLQLLDNIQKSLTVFGSNPLIKEMIDDYKKLAANSVEELIK